MMFKIMMKCADILAMVDPAYVLSVRENNEFNR